VAPEPVRIKLYGLVSRTRRGYLTHSVFEALCVVAVLSLWFLGWDNYKPKRERYERVPPIVRVAVAIVDQTPWIVLGAVAFKAIELWVVLKRFEAKEEQRRKQAAGKVNASSG
jgi:hypothetical protein